MNGNDDLYDWLTGVLGYDPQEAFDIAVGPEEEQGAREQPKPAATEAEPAPDPLKQVSSAILANEAMIREEELLENMWKSTGGLPMRPSVVSDLNSLAKHGAIQPTSKGFMYMGTPLTPPEQRTPQQAYDSMRSQGLIQPASRPLTPTDIGWTPYSDRFVANQRYQQTLQQTGDVTKALAAGGPELFSGMTAGASQAGVRSMSGQGTNPIIRNVAGRLVQYDPRTGTPSDITPFPRTEKDPNAHLRSVLQGRLATAQTALDVAKTGGDKTEIAAAQSQVDSITRQLTSLGGGFGISAPTTATTPPPSGMPRAGDVYKGYRFKGGNPRDKANWEKI